MIITPYRALVLVDIQYDFMPGGALAVPRGDEVVPVALGLMDRFEVVVATQDFHPRGHGSFARTHNLSPFTISELGGQPQVLWPDHCVAGTRGATLVDELPMARINEVFPKGTDPSVDSYSGFFDNGRRGQTGMERWLMGWGITDLVLVGLATDYCVKATALDAIDLGFEVTVVLEGCRAVNMNPGDGTAAVAEMEAAGVEVVQNADDLVS